MSANLPPDDDILLRLDALHNRQTESVRQMLREAGRLDLLADLDGKLREIRLGIDGARGTWHALSSAQRRALSLANHWGGALYRQPGRNVYGVQARGGEPLWPIRIATVRNLERRELLASEGGAFDPEAKAVLTERGRFVLKHGPADAGRAALQEGKENG